MHSTPPAPDRPRLSSNTSSVGFALAPAAEAALGRWLGAVSRWLAIIGGFALVGVVLMSVASIVGRALIDVGLSPIEGDYELVQFGCVVALAGFMPWCQMNRGHVTVDILFVKAPERLKLATQFVGDAVLFVLASIIVWRLWLGTLDKLRFHETTFILQMPIGWGYAAALIGMSVFALTCLYSTWRDLNDWLLRRTGGLTF